MSAATNIINFTLKQTVSFRPVITIVTPKVVNFTGWSAWSQWRPSIDSDELVAEFKVSDGGIIFNAAAQTVQLIRTEEQKAAIFALPYSRLVHEIFLVDPDGQPNDWVKGNVGLEKSVIRGTVPGA